MAKIFEKKVEPDDEIRQYLKLPSDEIFKNSSHHIKVRDHETNEIWSFKYIQKNGKSYLGGEHWGRFVKSKGITRGSKIEVYEEDDPYDREAPPYRIIVKPPS